MISNDPNSGVDLLQDPLNNLCTWKYGWMGAYIVDFGPLDLNVHFSVNEIFLKLRLCELVIYLVPTHLVPFPEHTCNVSIDRGWARGHAFF